MCLYVSKETDLTPILTDFPESLEKAQILRGYVKGNILLQSTDFSIVAGLPCIASQMGISACKQPH